MARGFLTAFLVIVIVDVSDVPAAEPDLQTMVDADWARQEERKGRTIEDSLAVRDVLASAERLLAALGEEFQSLDLQAERWALSRCAHRVGAVEKLNEEARRELYCEIRGITRGLVVKNPLLANRPLAFMKRRRFICQMLHEYTGYYYNYDGIHGGGVHVLDEPGISLKTRDLIGGRLPKGSYATAALSCDGRTIYFAFCKLSDAERPRESKGNHHGFPDAKDVPLELNYYSENRACFQIHAIDVDGSNLRQLTNDCEDNFNPCPMPDGTVVFMSSRRGGFCRCDNPFEPIPTTTLHSMEPDGSNQRILSYHETNEWHPAPLNDGRIAYCRWDYVDRSAAHYHGIWACNPDGSNPLALFGNYTKRISACYQPRSVPGSNRIAFIAGAHHADVGGSLALFDPSWTKLDEESGEDDFRSLEILTPEVAFPEAPDQWPNSFYHSPMPLSEDFFIVAFSFEPLSGMSSGVVEDTKTGLYYFDRYGNQELLYRDPDISSMNAMLLGQRQPPRQLPSVLDPTLGNEGEFFLADVNWSLLPFPANRPIRSLRVFQVLPKSETHVANRPRIGHANAESARVLLGTAPVEPDGSAYFRAPAGIPLYFQAVDGEGRAVQGMRSLTYLQPGERRGCVGCHEPSGTAPPRRMTLALQRAPSKLQIGPNGTQPMSYPQLVQPVLDRSCVSCHDGSNGDGKSKLALTGDPAGTFTRSYENLRPFLRWYEWGGASINQTVTIPGRMGADESPLTAILDDETHRSIELPQADRRRLNLWLDANVPFYGTYSQREQLAQQQGQAVAVPKMQ
jgi:hydrazine synthase alpha subunit-like protein